MKCCVLILCIQIYAVVANSADRFVDNSNLQIGFGKDCYLFWRGDNGYRKNGEFRCGTKKGDPMYVMKAKNGYYIGSNIGPLFWNGNPGNTKNAEFRKGKSPSDQFWIKKQSGGLYAIGFGNCPLYWRGDKGDVKNAEFRCGKPISDTFWIKGDGCKISKIQIIDNGDDATPDGEEIVGVTTAGSCSTGSNTLTLTNTKEVTEEVGVEISKSVEHNWQVSASVTVEASVKFLGSGGSVSATVETSFGGISKLW